MSKSTTRKLLGPLVLVAFFAAGISTTPAQHGAAHSGPTMNHHAVNERLQTGGHFVGDGLAELREQGIEVVIDLRDKPPAGQKDRLADAGIEWINIPVVWKSPQVIDFERFSAAMTEHKGRNVLVQCQANYRASAMTYLYRVSVENVPEAEARKDLNAIWTPEGRWQEYIQDILAQK